MATNFGTFSATSILTAAQLNNIGGAWTSFTPTWGGITLGSATNLGRYEQIGRLCVFQAHLTLSGSTVTGALTLTLPFTAARVYSGVYQLVLRDASVGDYVGIPRQASTTVVTLHAVSSSGSYAVEAATSSTVPFTWTDTDVIYVTGAYETSADPA